MYFFNVVPYLVPFMCDGKVCCLIMNMHDVDGICDKIIDIESTLTL